MKAPIAWEKAVLPAGFRTWNMSGAWNVHEENFFKTFSSVLSHLTFKASYSLTADRGPEYVTNSHAIITSYSPFRPFTSGQEPDLCIRPRK